MRKELYLLAAVAAFSAQTFCQTSVQRTNIKGGSSAWENFRKEMYAFSSFETGIVEYKNGKRYKGQLNYNKAIANIQFIDEKGDTLAIGNEETVKEVTIGTANIYYETEIMQNIMNLFPKEEEKISRFIKTQKLNLEKEDDLVQLAAFLEQL